MKKIIPITDFKLNADIQGFYLCKGKHLRTTRAGELFLDLILQDKTGEIGAKIWDRVSDFADKFKTGDAVAVRGRVESYQDKLQLVIGRINKATQSRYGRYGFKEEDLVPTSSLDPQKLWADIGQVIQKMNNKFLKRLVTDIYRKNKKTIQNIPASISMHYPYRTGFLEHVHSMVQSGEQLAKHYQADVDLLLAGIFLHGIGKVKELSDTLIPRFTDEGNFIGHTILSRDMIREAATGIKGFPEELLIQLEHLIVTHEGVFGGRYASKAKIKEALLLQFLDHMDTKLNLFDRVLNDDSEDGDWTSRRNYFGTSLYKGKPNKTH